jgi:hypothetical protein
MSESPSKCTWIVRVQYKPKKFRNVQCGKPATDVSWLDGLPVCDEHAAIEHAETKAAWDRGSANALAAKRRAVEGSKCSRCGAVLTLSHVGDLCESCFLIEPDFEGSDPSAVQPRAGFSATSHKF